MNVSVTTIWNEKIISNKEWILDGTRVLMGADGATWFGSPWVV